MGAALGGFGAWWWIGQKSEGSGPPAEERLSVSEPRSSEQVDEAPSVTERQPRTEGLRALPAAPPARTLAEARALRKQGRSKDALRLVDELADTEKDAHDADQRELLRIRLLIDLEQISLARGYATNFYLDYPDSPLVQIVQKTTGMHLPPERGAVRVSEGRLEARQAQVLASE